MAFSTKDVLKAMTGDAKLQLHALQVDGGAAANDWLMQFQADLLGVPVVRPDVVETTALGAAALAGLGVGVWRSPQEFLAGRKFRRFLPGDVAPGARAREAEWRRAVETRSEEHTSELQSRLHLVCRLLLEKKKKKDIT